jgi:L-aminopeptidase/D-esterase-like protein
MVVDAVHFPGSSFATVVEHQRLQRLSDLGIKLSESPAHTPYDGDTIFALASGEHPSDASIVGAFAAEVTAQAIRNAVREATSIGGILAMRDL